MAENAIPPDSQAIPSHPRSVAPRRFWQEENSFNNTNWRQWPLIKLRVDGLPPSTTTLHVYHNLSKFGNITRITLNEERPGQRTITSEVTFEPPPEQCFWDRRALEFDIDGQRAFPRARPDRYQPAAKSIKSPLQNGVEYSEKNELHGTSLGFGVLSDPTTMLIMASRGDAERQPKLVLNLWKKEIEVYFPVLHTSQRAFAWREFRFIIALDDKLAIWRLPDDNYILHLSKPPWYSKKLVQAVRQTHAVGARRWSEEDTWARQADLFAHKTTLTEIQSSPVTLHKEFNGINIFRWTTFHFQTLSKARTDGSAKTFFDALHDWNINVSSGDSFKIRDLTQLSAQLERNAWTLINSTHIDKKVYSFSQELNRISLPFSVRYQLEVCLSHGWLSEYSITPTFLHRLSQWGEKNAKQALVYVDTNQERLYDPMVLFSDIQYSKPVRPKVLPDSCIEIHSATVTATGILFHTPAVEITNRIVRNHKAQSHRFLRVRFEDDEYRGQSRLYPSTNNKMIMIFDRVRRALSRGIKLGNIHYDFLAWGNSQLREHGVYFFAATDHIDADRIRAEMGNFEEVVVAKKCARMGQCFSSTKAVHLQLPPITMSNVIPDIVRGDYNFTDGVGKISPLAASLVSDQLGIKIVPSLFQFRLGGCKGVLAVSKDVPGMSVLIRKSQFKFSSLSGELEIIRYAEFWQAFLNRQIIICLNNLGVRSEVFLDKQDDAIKALEKALQDDAAAIKALRTNVDPNRMTLSLAELVEAGFRTSKDPFVNGLLHLWRAWSLKYLKEKAKIPVTEGAFVLGTVDETGVLKGHTKACPTGNRETIERKPSYMEDLPQIFLQIIDAQTGQPKVIEGLCILARNPSLHAGDIRVVRAVNVPCLTHMYDVVVMPQTGDRDLPSMCSGGDLDGDDYIVIWDKTLIPTLWNVEPFHYDPPRPRVAKGEITTTDMINFFCDYLQNDSLGRIATAHLAAADEMPDSLWNPSCLELAALHSRAVDYPKTGVPARMERRHERNQWPHFMEKKSSREYHSNRVLGKLYDAVQKIKFTPDWNLSFDPRILHAFKPSNTLYEAVQTVKKDYDSSLRRILNQHAISTEFELWSTFVLHHSKASRDFKFHEEVGMLSRTLKEQFYEVLVEIANGKDYDHLAPIAVAAYRCTYDQLQVALNEVELGTRKREPDSMPFISFPWVLQDTLIKIAIRTSDTSLKDIKAGIENGDIVGLDHEDPNINLLNCASANLQMKAEDLVKSHHLSEHLPDPYQPREAQHEPQVHSEHDLLTVKLPVAEANNIATEKISSLISEGSNEAPDISQTVASQRSKADQSVKFEHSRSTQEDQIEALIETLKSSNEKARTDEVHNVGASMQATGSLDFSNTTHPEYSSEIPNTIENTKKSYDTFPTSPLVHTSYSTSPGPSKVLDFGKTLPRPGKEITCHFWKSKNNCMYTSDECERAHWDTGHYGPLNNETCWFWKNNHCVNTAEDCLFAHYDTGSVAPQPHRSDGSSPMANRGAVANSTKRVVVHDSDSSDDDEYTNDNFVWPTQNKHRTSLLNTVSPAKSTRAYRSPLPRARYEYHHSYLYGNDASAGSRLPPADYALPPRSVGFNPSSTHACSPFSSQTRDNIDKHDPFLSDDVGEKPSAGQTIHTQTAKAPQHDGLHNSRLSTVYSEAISPTRGDVTARHMVDSDDTSTLSSAVPPSRPLADPFETASEVNDFGSDVVFG